MTQETIIIRNANGRSEAFQLTDTLSGSLGRYLSGSGINYAININDLDDNLNIAGIRGLSERVRSENLPDGRHSLRYENVGADFNGGEDKTINRFLADINLEVNIGGDNVEFVSGTWSQSSRTPWDLYDFNSDPTRGSTANLQTRLVDWFGERWSDVTFGRGTEPYLIAIIGERQIDVRQPSNQQLDTSVQPCFAAGTQIVMADGTTLSIEEVAAGSIVSSFPEHGNPTIEGIGAVRASLSAGNVVRTFNNVTEDWVEVQFVDPATRETKVLTATPGHVMLTPEGGYKQLIEMIEPRVEEPALGDARTDVQALGDYAGSVRADARSPPPSSPVKRWPTEWLSKAMLAPAMGVIDPNAGPAP